MLTNIFNSFVRPSRLMISVPTSLLSLASAVCVIFLPHLANASTLGFAIVSSARDVNATDVVFTTERETDGTRFSRVFTANSLDVSAVLTPLDLLAEVLDIEPLIGNNITNTTKLSFSNTVRLVGDVGAKAIVRGFASVDGQYTHFIDALPRGDAQSNVKMDIEIKHISGPSLVDTMLTTNRESNNRIVFNETDELSSDFTRGSEVLAVVGDEFIISGYFESKSGSNIDEQCVPNPFGGCLFYVPGVGLSASNTLGRGTVSLSATAFDDPPAPVPLPASFLMFASALAGLAALRRRVGEASS